MYELEQELHSLISRLGVVNLFILIAEVCEDRVVTMHEQLEPFYNYPVDFEGVFNEQIANELSAEYHCQVSYFVNVYQKYHQVKNNISFEQQVVNVLRSIQPSLQVENYFQEETHKHFVYHRDKYQPYFTLDLMISDLGIKPFITMLTNIYHSRYLESQYFYLNGIYGEWQEYLNIVQKLSSLVYYRIQYDM